jgi:hypothetical protein
VPAAIARLDPRPVVHDAVPAGPARAPRAPQRRHPALARDLAGPARGPRQPPALVRGAHGPRLPRAGARPRRDARGLCRPTGPSASAPATAATVENSVYLSAPQRRQGLGRLAHGGLDSPAPGAGAPRHGGGDRPANDGLRRRCIARSGSRKAGHAAEIGRKAGRWLDLMLMQKRLVTAPRGQSASLPLQRGEGWGEGRGR